MELVRRGLARSREHAAALVRAGGVRVDGRPVTKPSANVTSGTSLTVDGAAPDYASRGGHKLDGALDALGGPPIGGRRCLDAGASTGGFTDVLLRRGAREVIAVDVGRDQLAAELRQDPRVTVLDGVNVRYLTVAELGRPGAPVDVTVADLSFISLRLVLPALAACTGPGGDLVPLVKPQFEVGRERLPRDGVVRDPGQRAAAVLDVARSAAELGLGTVAVARSPLPGPAGNVEFFLWLRADAPPPDPAAVHEVATRPPHASNTSNR